MSTSVNYGLFRLVEEAISDLAYFPLSTNLQVGGTFEVQYGGTWINSYLALASEQYLIA